LLLALGLYLSLALGVDSAGPDPYPWKPVVSPPANAHDVDRGSTVSVTYDQFMDPATVNPQSFVVHAMSTGHLQGTHSARYYTCAGYLTRPPGVLAENAYPCKYQPCPGRKHPSVKLPAPSASA
jgi:hypothetical protein